MAGSMAGSMLSCVVDTFEVCPIKSRNAAEQEAIQDSAVIFLPLEAANDSSFANLECLYTPATRRVKPCNRFDPSFSRMAPGPGKNASRLQHHQQSALHSRRSSLLHDAGLVRRMDHHR